MVAVSIQSLHGGEPADVHAQSLSGTSPVTKAFSSAEPMHAGIMPSSPHRSTHWRSERARCVVRLKHTPPQVELGAAVAPAGQVGGEGVARAADTISSSSDTLGQQAAIITGRAGRSPRYLVVVGRPR